MPHYRITDEARADLDAIWLYVAERGGIDTADRLIDAIIERFPLLASTPGMGFAREDFAPGLRSFPVGDYLIFYRRASGHIDIIRVLHGTRDLSRFFQS
jgi:toxin ParE1/3/4